MLGIADTASFTRRGERANERLSREVLEFKRQRNKTTPDNERHIEFRISCLLDGRLGLLSREPSEYREFLSPQERKEFLNRLAPETAALRSSYGLPPFPVFDAQRASRTWRPYPGLHEVRREEIQRQYDRINGRLEFRLARLRARTTRVLRRSRARLTPGERPPGAPAAAVYPAHDPARRVGRSPRA